MMTTKAFTQAYFEKLKALYPDNVYEILDDLSIAAKYEGRDIKHYLDNPYKEYLQSPDLFEEIVEKYSASVLGFQSTENGIQLDAIVPLIKPVDFLDSLRNLARENGQEKESWVIYEHYNEHLIIVYAEDTPKSIRYFTQEEFEKLGIPKETLQKLAVENLSRILPEMQRQGEDGLFVLLAGGDYEASLLLFDGIWSVENFPVKGELVVAVPNRDLLLVTGSEEYQKLAAIKEILKNAYTNGHHSISPYLFKWNGKKFVLFVTEEDRAKWN